MLACFLLLPILVIVPLSFSTVPFCLSDAGCPLHWYRDLFDSAEWIRAAKNSFIVAPAAARDGDGPRDAGGGRPRAETDFPARAC